VDNFSEIPPDFEGEVSEVFNRRGPDIQFQEELALATGKTQAQGFLHAEDAIFPLEEEGIAHAQWAGIWGPPGRRAEHESVRHGQGAGVCGCGGEEHQGGATWGHAMESVAG
jgi:hypothetical protein